ncbi:ArsA family ATPase [Oceanobacillus oncorhynchi]|uniref:Arsenical pump-driving ATPase n=1 Tax=Oceanobacillus oncorhynchi TaxID=545501 RepID=A0A0A1MYN4_9BACI|nr:ArsA family ATPase [Oceanobacillus oncorhynchi]MDM8100896.1 ArsA family ATPase [Oceanobacillus oncorhynchi]UUI38772.1 ArsA family ATPase [Oceanobacillus oncorhynchi]CEI84477.1 Arsenical pump-driving ATPase [Oceanobacillus oncorhynchi]
MLGDNNRIIFVGGKGGVGKSSSAAALATGYAEKGYRTLLISTDPAHNISDIFQRQIGGNITYIEKNLYALEIDSEKETDAYIQKVKENIQGVVHVQMMEEVHRQLDTAKASPGADEAALFDKLISIILEEGARFDKLVFDTAPTGHTIRLLSLPELMGIWIEGLLNKRKKTNTQYSQLLNDGQAVDDPIYDTLQERKQRFTKAREILLDKQATTFLFVLNPEKLPISETKKAIHLLEKFQIDVPYIIVNKVLPEETGAGFFEKRKQNEKIYLERIAVDFSAQTILYIPFFSEDITNRKQLKQMGAYLKEVLADESTST